MGLIQPTKSIDELEKVIATAIKKVSGTKENDLCKYIPSDEGGYMHHFTLKKMKSKSPNELKQLINRYILEAPKPRSIQPKQRAARGSKKKRDQITFTKIQLNRLLSIARLAGDKEMISVLSPRKSLSTIKRELINSIKNDEVDQNLWDLFSQNATAVAELTSRNDFVNPLDI